MDPLCTVTVSLLRVTASTAFADGLPPCGAWLPATERGLITAVSTDPEIEDPAIGL